jgi:hypothetical protein
MTLDDSPAGGDEWRRAGRYTSKDVHQALFEEAPEPRTLEELKEGVRRYCRSANPRHASFSASRPPRRASRRPHCASRRACRPFRDLIEPPIEVVGPLDELDEPLVELIGPRTTSSSLSLRSSDRSSSLTSLPSRSSDRPSSLTSLSSAWTDLSSTSSSRSSRFPGLSGTLTRDSARRLPKAETRTLSSRMTPGWQTLILA